MKKESKKFLLNLLKTPSPSGFEEKAAELFEQYVSSNEVVSVDGDVHGNTYAHVNQHGGVKVMLAGHIDEIGLMVTHIDGDGYLSLSQIGGMDPALLVGQRVKILTDNGEVAGVIGRKAIHLMTASERSNGVTNKDIWVDIGAKDKEDAEKKVSVGDPLVVDVDPFFMGDYLVARGCDDRAGVYVVAEVVRKFAKNINPDVHLIGVATVQEEVGLRGASTATKLIQPHIGIAIDVTFATDHPQTDAKEIGECKLGGGPVIARGPNIDKEVERGLREAADRKEIKYQLSPQARITGTDCGTMQIQKGGGVETALVSIPNRYMHTPVEIVHKQDLDNIVDMIVEYLKSI